MPNERDLELIFRGMSRENLDLYKRQLRQSLTTLNPDDRSAVLARIKGIPELADIGLPAPTPTMQPIPEPQPLRPFEAPPEEMPAWKQALHWATSPFQWVHEEAILPFAAIVTSPFSPAVEGVEGMGWLERELSEYEKWQAPWGVKFAVETLPWLAMPTGVGMMGRLGGLAAKGGALARPAALGAKALRPVAAVEKAITYPVTKPLEKLAEKLAPKVAEVGERLLPDLQPVEEAMAIATQPSRLRGLATVKIAGKQPFTGLLKLIGGRAAIAKNPAEMAMVGRDVLRFEGANKAIVAASTLERLGASKKLFNLGDDLLIQSGSLKGVHIETLRTYPRKYAQYLTPEQNAWLKQSSLLEKEKRELFRRYDIEIRDLTIEEGGEYAGRRVVIKLNAQTGDAEFAYIGKGGTFKPGIKTAQEKTRVFATAEEATALGYRYAVPEETLYYNIVAAYNRVADKQWTDWFLQQVPYRTVAVTGQAAASGAEMREIQGALKQINSISLRLKNREPIPGQMLKGIKEYYPKEYEQIRLLIKQGGKVRQPEVDSLLKFVRNQQGFYKREWGEVAGWFKQARQSAVRPGFTGTMAPDIPAFAGKVFTGLEAKEHINIIRRGLDPGFNRALGAINQVNAIGRYFALAGDVSPFGIQLIFLAGAHPTIYGRAMGGFVRAFFDRTYHANLLAKHAGTIQKHPGLVLTKGGTTEMTEAMASYGLLRKQPLKIGGKILEPFQRGYESALDTAGIYMAEAYEHLATSAVRTAQVDAFINEFRGLMNTKRIGVTSIQRQLESFAVLAPQYNRAIATLMTDLAQGNLRGELARRAVFKGTVAIMAMSVAISYVMGDTEEEMIDHLNPLSPNFMTWDIAGQRVGPGSKVRSLLFTAGKMIKSPEDTAYHAARFLRGNFAPVLGTSIDLITGKNYVGDPTRDGLMNISRTVIAENLLPIWVQSVALEGGDLKGRVIRGLAEFGGARGYPMGAYGELRALQDKLAETKFGMTWEELGTSPQYGKLYQRQLERENPKLEELSKTAAEESEKWAHGEQLVWNEYNQRVDQINLIVSEELNVASLQFEQTRDGSRFRDRVNRALWLKSQMRNELLESDEFGLVKEYYAQPLTPEARAKISPQDLAYREYNEIMYAPDMYDEFGEYKFEEADRRRETLIQNYGFETMNYIEAMIGEGRADEPPALQALREARKILRPYWDIVDQVWAQYSPELRQLSDQIRSLEKTNPDLAKRYLMAYPMLLNIRKQIAQYKKQMKTVYPQMKRALDLFYG